jgi:hypothetical protein
VSVTLPYRFCVEATFPREDPEGKPIAGIAPQSPNF